MILQRVRLLRANANILRHRRVLMVAVAFVFACLAAFATGNSAHADGWQECVGDAPIGLMNVDQMVDNPRVRPITRFDDGYFNMRLVLSCYPDMVRYEIHASDGTPLVDSSNNPVSRELTLLTPSEFSDELKQAENTSGRGWVIHHI